MGKINGEKRVPKSITIWLHENMKLVQLSVIGVRAIYDNNKKTTIYKAHFISFHFTYSCKINS